MVASDAVVVGVGFVAVVGAGVDAGVSVAVGVVVVVGTGSLETGVVVVEEGAVGAASSARAMSGLLAATNTDALTSSTVLVICLIDRILPPYLSLLTWCSGRAMAGANALPITLLSYCLAAISWSP